MRGHSTISIEEGKAKLCEFIRNLPAEAAYWNEAETRFSFIDLLLVECLGWSRNQIHPERHVDGDYVDYVVGDPASALWEAKRVGVYFDFPADVTKPVIQSISGIFAASPSTEAAMRQVQSYCNDMGVEVAVCCNGPQIVVFLGQKVGQSWLKGRAIVIRNFDEMQKNFSVLWQCLSPDGLAERHVHRILNQGASASIPRKLSSYLVNFPSFRYKTDIQANLRTIAELLLEDIVRSSGMKKRFYEECYCDTGALSRDALVSQRILEARYAALFPPADESPRLEPASNEGDRINLTRQILTEALAKRPIVLLGDVGVGKTSFVEDLIYIRANKEFESAITLYINLGSNAAFTQDLAAFVLNDIERQLYENYQVDIRDHDFVRGVYDLEVKRFRNSFKAKVYQQNKEKLDEALMQDLDRHIEDRAEHLRRSVEHIANARKRQVVIILDNADQRNSEIQQAAFIISQDLAQNWNSLVFIAVRPHTFFQSKRAGALSAYPHKVLTILPPRPEAVIEKRLIFALKVAEGKIPAETLKGVRLHMESMALFLEDVELKICKISA